MNTITLRQARKIESSLSNLRIEGQVTDIRTYDRDVANRDVNDAIQDVSNDMEMKLTLTRLRYRIKHAINAKNMECGVSQLLNTRDRLYAEKDLLNSLLKPDDVQRQLDLHIGDPEEDKHRMNIVQDCHWDSAAAELDIVERAIEETQRQINSLNHSEMIDLTDSEMDRLEWFGAV